MPNTIELSTQLGPLAGSSSDTDATFTARNPLRTSSLRDTPAVVRTSPLDSTTDRVRSLVSGTLYDDFHKVLKEQYADYSQIDAAAIQHPRLMQIMAVLTHHATLWTMRICVVWNILSFVIAGAYCDADYAHVDIFAFFVSMIQWMSCELLSYAWKTKSFSIKLVGIDTPYALNYQEFLSLVIHAISSNNSLHLGKYGDGLPTDDDLKYAYISASFVVSGALIGFFVARMAFIFINNYFGSTCYQGARLATSLIYSPSNIIFIISSLTIVFVILMILVTCLVFYYFIGSWLDRILCLRLMRIKDLTQFPMSAPPGANVNANPSPLIQARILRRDAYERYFYMLYFLRKCSDYWNFPLSVLWVAAIAISIGSIYFLIISAFDKNPLLTFTGDLLTFILMPLMVTVVIMPFTFALYCNTASARILDAFSHSIPRPWANIVITANSAPEATASEAIMKSTVPFSGQAEQCSNCGAVMRPKPGNSTDLDESLLTDCDFEIIGGKEEWLAFIRANPLQMTVVGITPTVAILAQIAAGSIGTGLSTLFLFFSRGGGVDTAQQQ